MNAPTTEPDLWTGMAAIAAHLGMGRRQAQYLHETNILPTFTIAGGKKIDARRSTLNTWLADEVSAAATKRQADADEFARWEAEGGKTGREDRHHG